MAFSKTKLCNVVAAVVFAFLHVALADHNDEVFAAVDILSSIGPFLAAPFCSDYIHYEEPTETCYVTQPAYTVTTTLWPEPCSVTTHPTKPDESNETTWDSGSETHGVTSEKSGPIETNTPTMTAKPTETSSYVPGLITVTSTTTITYTTTSTIYVPAPTPLYKRSPDEPQDANAFQRATWCSNYDVPCRLVQYTHDVIADACGKYLASGQEVVTVTKDVPGPRITETEEAKGCGTEYVEGEPERYEEHGYEEDKPESHSDNGGNEGHDESYHGDGHENEHEEIPPHFDFEDGNSFDFGSDDGTDTPEYEYEEDGTD